MIRKTTPTFGKDLRYLSRRPSSGRSRVFGHPSHWVATLFIAVAVGIWLGSAPDAAVERSSITLKKQIELVKQTIFGVIQRMASDVFRAEMSMLFLRTQSIFITPQITL